MGEMQSEIFLVLPHVVDEIRKRQFTTFRLRTLEEFLKQRSLL